MRKLNFKYDRTEFNENKIYVNKNRKWEKWVNRNNGNLIIYWDKNKNIYYNLKDNTLELLFDNLENRFTVGTTGQEMKFKIYK